jgi:hypothetical protein
MVSSPFPHLIKYITTHLTHVNILIIMLIIFSIYKELNLVVPSLPLPHSTIKGIRITHRNTVLMLKSLNKQKRISYIQSLKTFYLDYTFTFKFSLPLFIISIDL